MGNCHTFSEQDVKIWETETCDTEIGWDGVECMVPARRLWRLQTPSRRHVDGVEAHASAW